MAVCLPLLVTILLALWDFGRLIDAYQLVANSAREAARRASTGQATNSEVQQAVVDYLKAAGAKTTGVAVTVTNLTQAARSDPSAATQLDSFQVAVSVPSNNFRWIVLPALQGTATLRATSTWKSMRDIPLSMPSSIPLN